MGRRNWTHDELLLTFNLYCKLPFGLYHRGNPEVISLSELIGRTPSAVAMKLSNFASLDPKHQSRGIKGLSNVSNADRNAWQEFTGNWDRTAWESEILLSRLKKERFGEGIETEESAIQTGELADWGTLDIDETEVERVTKTRIGQRFFRNTILANYRSRCCVCGMSIPRLLIASHIIPWRDREDLRLNPHNGLCMCALHDKAFDAGFIAVDERYQIVVSKQVSEYLPNDSVEMNIIRHSGNQILLPDKFMPDQGFLNYHIAAYFLND
jgi:putative restriction endonuclease